MRSSSGEPTAPVHVFSLKVGTAHGLWQYKVSGTHEKIVLHSLRHILDATCQLLGFDATDRSVVYLFRFSAEPFQDFQVCLVKTRETSDGCRYRVDESGIGIGEFRAEGVFPSFVRTSYLGAWPERIYFTLERSMTGGIVN